ncbi:HicB family toxin-antitoxin system [Mycobacterium sp.]|uniref:HicB family toxin-antitoxin system n=1 Tax=Mycobacterium sp. TaxID=1785 RepID=UPI002BAC4F44|nr:HicB family toxin-antitoxin system [Mycobacterium sp.]HTQ22426.1 HicB family toxin-antitoxin system [Mycobacterium sp.]
MAEYKIEITRDGRWWMVHIPEFDGLTQARRLSEAELMGREWIAVSTGTPINDIAVHVAGIYIDGVDVRKGASEVSILRHQAATAEQAAQAAAGSFAKRLTGSGIPVRDIATLLGVSPQRVSQLATASKEAAARRLVGVEVSRPRARKQVAAGSGRGPAAAAAAKDATRSRKRSRTT